MKNFRKLVTSIFCVSVCSLALISCIKDTALAPEGVADVIIQDMKTDAGIKYGIVVYASANMDIASAKVTAPGTPGKIYQLTATTNKMQFVYTPQDADYDIDMPVKGDYSIEIVTASGQTLRGKDAVGDEKLTPIVIKTATMTSQTLKTTWDKVADADAYVVKLYSANKAELLFSSTYLSADAVNFEFSSSSAGWTYGVSPVINTDYVIELLGVKVETGVTIDPGNNLQFITVDSKTIKWE